MAADNQPFPLLLWCDGLSWFFHDLFCDTFPSPDGREPTFFDITLLLSRLFALNEANFTSCVHDGFLNLTELAQQLKNVNEADCVEITPLQTPAPKYPDIKKYSNKVGSFFLLISSTRFQTLANLLTTTKFHCHGVFKLKSLVSIPVELWPDSQWFYERDTLPAQSEVIRMGQSSKFTQALDCYFIDSEQNQYVLGKWRILLDFYANDLLQGKPMGALPASPTPAENLAAALVVDDRPNKYRKIIAPPAYFLDPNHLPWSPLSHDLIAYPIYSAGFAFTDKTHNRIFRLSNTEGFVGKRALGVDQNWIQTAVRELAEEMFFCPDITQLPPLVRLQHLLELFFLEPSQDPSVRQATRDQLETLGLYKLSFKTKSSASLFWYKNLCLVLKIRVVSFVQWIEDQFSGFFDQYDQLFEGLCNPLSTQIPVTKCSDEIIQGVSVMERRKYIHDHGRFWPDRVILDDRQYLCILATTRVKQPSPFMVHQCQFRFPGPPNIFKFKQILK
jgi:hypothetical protein